MFSPGRPKLSVPTCTSAGGAQQGRGLEPLLLITSSLNMSRHTSISSIQLQSVPSFLSTLYSLLIYLFIYFDNLSSLFQTFLFVCFLLHLQKSFLKSTFFSHITSFFFNTLYSSSQRADWFEPCTDAFRSWRVWGRGRHHLVSPSQTSWRDLLIYFTKQIQVEYCDTRWPSSHRLTEERDPNTFICVFNMAAALSSLRFRSTTI